MSSVRSFLFTQTAALMALSLVLLLVSDMPDAFAQAKTLGDAQANIAHDIVVIPRFVAYIAYILGAAFAVGGLLKLKDWLGDSERNTLNAALFRLIVASLLVYLPYGIVVITGTLFGSASSTGVPNSDNTNVPPPNFSKFQ